MLATGEDFTFSFDRDLTLNVGETHLNVATVIAEDDEGDTASERCGFQRTARQSTGDGQHPEVKGAGEGQGQESPGQDLSD